MQNPVEEFCRSSGVLGSLELASLKGRDTTSGDREKRKQGRRFGENGQNRNEGKKEIKEHGKTQRKGGISG